MKRKIQRWWRIFHATHLLKSKLKFIGWFHDRFKGKYCWADCVAWAYNPSQFNPFKAGTSKGCKIESKQHDTKMCYCGGWNNGVCWDTLPKQEQERQIKERELDRLLTPENLPF